MEHEAHDTPPSDQAPGTFAEENAMQSQRAKITKEEDPFEGISMAVA